MISRQFITSSLVYTLAGALPMASAILLLPFYLHYLSTDEFGALAIYMAISVLIQVVTTFGFDSALYVYYHEFKNDQKKLRQYIPSIFIFIILLGVAVVILLFFTGDLLVRWVFENRDISFLPFGLIAIVTGICQALFKVHNSLLQTSERPVIFFWSNLLSFSLIVIFTVAGLESFSNPLVGPVGGRMLAGIVSAGWVLIRVFSQYSFRYNFQVLRLSFDFNKSTFIYQLQLWFTGYFDRFLMVFYHLSMAEIGIYDFAMKCMLAIDFIIGGLNNSFTPKVIGIIMGQSSKGSTPETNRYFYGLVSVIMVFVSFCILAFSLIIDFGFVKSGYEAALPYLPLIGIIYVIRPIRYFFALPYGALKYSKPLPIIYTFIFILKVLLIVITIADYRIYALVGTSIVVGIVELGLLWRFAKDRFTFRVNVKKLFIAPFTLIVFILVFESMAMFPRYLTYGMYLLVSVGMLLWIYRKELRFLKSFKFLR